MLQHPVIISTAVCFQVCGITEGKAASCFNRTVPVKCGWTWLTYTVLWSPPSPTHLGQTIVCVKMDDILIAPSLLSAVEVTNPPPCQQMGHGTNWINWLTFFHGFCQFRQLSSHWCMFTCWYLLNIALITYSVVFEWGVTSWLTAELCLRLSLTSVHVEPCYHDSNTKTWCYYADPNSK